MTRSEPSIRASLFIAAWAVVDAWLIYGAVQWLIWAL